MVTIPQLTQALRHTLHTVANEDADTGYRAELRRWTTRRPG